MYVNIQQRWRLIEKNVCDHQNILNKFPCAFPPEISSILCKSFPFPYIVLFVLRYFPLHVVNTENNVIYKWILLAQSSFHRIPHQTLLRLPNIWSHCYQYQTLHHSCSWSLLQHLQSEHSICICQMGNWMLHDGSTRLKKSTRQSKEDKKRIYFRQHIHLTWSYIIIKEKHGQGEMIVFMTPSWWLRNLFFTWKDFPPAIIPAPRHVPSTSPPNHSLALTPI